jgi:integrase
LAAYLAYWHRDVVVPNLAPLTASTYETFIRLYIVPGLGAKRLDRLQVRDVQSWLNMVAKTCQCCAQEKDLRRSKERRRCCAAGHCCNSIPSSRTVKDIRGVLRSALNHAMTEELVSKNVASLAKLPTLRRRKGKAWSSEEARHFLESAMSEADPLYAAFMLVLVLGLRKGEVLGLGEDDVDLTAGELRIGWQLQRVARQLLRRQTKTEGSDASLPLPDVCAAVLKRRAEDKAADRFTAGPLWQDSTLVFTGRYGTPVEPRTFNRAWDRRCLQAGVRKITVHDARRTFATLLVDLDVHPRVIMQVLRHAEMSVTMEIYSQASSAATRDALKRLGDSLR